MCNFIIDGADSMVDAKKKKKSGQDIEHDIIDVAERNQGKRVMYHGKEYTVVGSAKPSSDSGEPKTDVFIRLVDDDGMYEDVCISCKKTNASFIENKMSADTMKAYWGENAEDIIHDIISVSGLIDKIQNRQLVFPDGTDKIKDTLVITQGYRLDITCGNGGDLSTKIMDDDIDGIANFLSGGCLNDDKRNAFVELNGKRERIEGSGVANVMYRDDDVPDDIQKILDMTFPVDDYARQIAEKGGLNIELKAVNYREDRDKSADGNRPLAVMLEYSVDDDGKVHVTAHYDTPGEYRCNNVLDNIREIKGNIPHTVHAESATKAGLKQKRAKETRKSEKERVKRENNVNAKMKQFAYDRIEEIKKGKLNATLAGKEKISANEKLRKRQWNANISGYDVVFVEGYTKGNGQVVSSYMRCPPHSNYTREDVMNKFNSTR